MGQDDIHKLSADGYDAVVDDDCGDFIDKLRAAFNNENVLYTDSGDENAGIAETPHTPQDLRYTSLKFVLDMVQQKSKTHDKDISGNLKSILGHVCPPQESGTARTTTMQPEEKMHPEKAPSGVPTPVLWPYFKSLGVID